MNDKIFEIMLNYGTTPLAATAITTHVMEFITWIRDNQHQLFTEPTEDIYQYWLTNIYNH